MAILTLFLFNPILAMVEELLEIQLHIYPDNSVKAVFAQTRPISYYANYLYDLRIHHLQDKIDFNFTYDITPTYTYTPSNFLSISVKLETSPQLKDLVTVLNATIKALQTDGELNITTENVVIRINYETLQTTLTGKVLFEAMGSATGVLDQIQLISGEVIETQVQAFLEQAFKYTGKNPVDVESFIVNRIGNRVTVEFSIKIDLSTLTWIIGLDVNFAKEYIRYVCFTKLSILMSGYYGPERVIVEGEIGTNTEILLIGIANLLVNFGEYTRGYFLGSPIDSKTISLLKDIGNLISNFTNTFDILPSETKLQIKAVPNNYESFYFETPKIVKSDAKTPGDTLKALYDYVMNALETLNRYMQPPIPAEKVLATPVELIPENGVKVYLNETEVNNVTFADLPRLKVISPETKTPIESPFISTDILILASVSIVLIAGVVIAVLKLIRK